MFKRKHIVITGGSSGLGLALACGLAEQGAHLTLIARNPVKLAEAKVLLQEKMPDATVHTDSVDVSDARATEQALQRIADRGNGIDVLINSAGVLREGTIETLSTSDYQQLININFLGVVNVVKAALPFLLQRQGHIVNIASVAGLTSVYGYSAYAASKHALVGFTETLRYELKPRGIKVQLVCPGEFDSPMVDSLNRYRSPENRAHTQLLPPTTTDQVARHTLRAMRSERFLVLPGFTTRAMVFGVQHFRLLTRRIGDYIIARAGRSSAP